MPFYGVERRFAEELEDILTNTELPMVERIQGWLDLVGAELDVSRATFTIKRIKFTAPTLNGVPRELNQPRAIRSRHGL